jgi:molybdopterin/thiamine biosynthesis adenylyltransferase
MINIGAFFHEKLYRSEAAMLRLRELNLLICGGGALGANMLENLARVGCARLKIIDRDRVEEQNLSTQPYHRSDIGAFKAKILASMLYRALGIIVDARAEPLTDANANKLLGGSALIVDTFDNSAARQAIKRYCDGSSTPCLHVGLANGYAEAIWNENYRVPSAAQDDICDYPLARNLVMLAVAVASEAIIAFAVTGERRSFTVTLKDFAVKQF